MEAAVIYYGGCLFIYIKLYIVCFFAKTCTCNRYIVYCFSVVQSNEILTLISVKMHKKYFSKKSKKNKEKGLTRPLLYNIITPACEGAYYIYLYIRL